MMNEEHELLLGIPDEMWENILKGTRMKSNDLANFRLVNKKSNALAVNLFDRWIVKIDDRHENKEERGPYLETLLDLRVEELKIVNLVDPLSFRPPWVVLKYPDILKVIKTEDWSTSNKVRMVISAENLHALLRSKNLEELDLKLVGANINSLVYSSQPPLIGYDLSKVQKMTIEISAENMQLELIEGNLLQRILKTSIFSNLNCLDIHFVPFNLSNLRPAIAYQLNSYLLECIVKYGHTLKSVKCFICGNGEMGFPSFLESVDESQLEICSNLESLTVISDFLQGTWRQLLGLQKKLVNLKFSRSIPMSLFRMVIDKNFNTLGDIHLSRLEIDEVLVGGVPVRLFDFSIFLNCSSLRNLKIFVGHLAEGRNLSVLNQKIELLSLYQILCFSEDLLMFSSNRVQLKSLTLNECGNMGDFGIAGSVLENLLALSQLTTLRIFGNCLNRSVPDNWSVFLKRDPNTDLWYKFYC